MLQEDDILSLDILVSKITMYSQWCVIISSKDV